VTVAAIEGNRVLLVEPIRIDMPSVSNVRRLSMIRHSGVEDLTLEQTSKHWTNLLGFSGDYACWVRGVKLVNAGVFPSPAAPRTLRCATLLSMARSFISASVAARATSVSAAPSIA
jgi:hypothetical protein